MATRKGFAFNELRQMHKRLGEMIAVSDAATAEYAAATGGAAGDPEESDQPAAQDSLPVMPAIVETAEENRVRNHYANMRNLVPGGDRLHNPKPRKGDL